MRGSTLNVLQLQKSCPLWDLNLRPFEQNWSALTTKRRINLCYIGVFTSFYQWNAINPVNKPKLQKSCPLRDLNLRPLEQNWSALTTKTKSHLCYIGVFTSFYQWNAINPVNKPKLQKSCSLKDLNHWRPLEQNRSVLTSRTSISFCCTRVFYFFFINWMQKYYKSNLKKICGTWDWNIRSLAIEYQVKPLHHSSFCDRRGKYCPY
jgi:hypothetical protein